MITAVLAVLGVIFGSFVSALVWRLHELSRLSRTPGKAKKRGKRRATPEKPLTAKDLSIVTGRSMCPNCHHELAAKDLVPVLSWLALHGKCRYCQAPIPDSPLVELTTGLLFAVSYAVWPHSVHGVGLFQFVLWLIFLVGFMALAVYDIRWFLLPDKIVFPLTALALLQVTVVAATQHSLSDFWLSLAGGAIIFGFFWMLFQVSGGNWIGGGDVKLGIVLGLLAGTPLRALTVIFFASLIGTVISIPQLLKGKKGLTRHIPFGPSLLLATVIIVLWAGPITDWYQGLILR
jgi:prepilin signal peptidase PulO-like enzyme (type II secretory pathway)